MKRMVFALAMMVVACCAGCAGNNYQAVRPADYPSTHRMFDLTFGWKRIVAEGGVTIDGYVRNTRYYLITDMDMIVQLVDDKGRERARESFSFIPDRLPMDGYSRFSVSLRAMPQPGDIFRFMYRYAAQEGGTESLEWRHSFEVSATE